MLCDDGFSYGTGRHRQQVAQGERDLSIGLHPITITFFEIGGGAGADGTCNDDPDGNVAGLGQMSGRQG
jgi:hypothetical protein